MPNLVAFMPNLIRHLRYSLLSSNRINPQIYITFSFISYPYQHYGKIKVIQVRYSDKYIKKEVPRINKMLEDLKGVFSSMQKLTQRVIASGTYKHIKPVKVIIGSPNCMVGVQ